MYKSTKCANGIFNFRTRVAIREHKSLNKIAFGFGQIYNLLDVFPLLSTPRIMNSDNGNRVFLWLEVILIHGKPRFCQS